MPVYQLPVLSNKPTTHYTKDMRGDFTSPGLGLLWLIYYVSFLCCFALFSLQMRIQFGEVYLLLITPLYSTICTQDHCTVAKSKASNHISKKKGKKKKKQQHKKTNRKRRSSVSGKRTVKWNELFQNFFSDQIKSRTWALWS